MEDRCHHIQPPAVLSFVKLIIAIILSVIISTGNLLILIAVVKDPYKNLRSPFMYFLVNSAVSDILIGLIMMPYTVYTHVLQIRHETHDFHFLIEAGHILFYVLSTASIFSFAALCMDRYFAVLHPFIYRRKFTILGCLAVSAVVWVFSISMPFLCLVTGHKIYHLIYANFAVAATVAILLFTHVSIFRRLRKNDKKLTNCHQGKCGRINANGTLDRKQSKRSSAAPTRDYSSIHNLFKAILCAYIIVYVPVLIISYTDEFCVRCDCKSHHILRDLIFILVAGSSAINPIMCIIRLRPFRRAVKRIFGYKPSMNVEFENIIL